MRKPLLNQWQYENVKDLIEVGDKAEAQRIILNALVERELGNAQQSVHLIAFRRRLAWLFFGFIGVLAMVLVIIGGK